MLSLFTFLSFSFPFFLSLILFSLLSPLQSPTFATRKKIGPMLLHRPRCCFKVFTMHIRGTSYTTPMVPALAEKTISLSPVITENFQVCESTVKQILKQISICFQIIYTKVYHGGLFLPISLIIISLSNTSIVLILSLCFIYIVYSSLNRSTACSLESLITRLFLCTTKTKRLTFSKSQKRE